MVVKQPSNYSNRTILHWTKMLPHIRFITHRSICSFTNFITRLSLASYSALNFFFYYWIRINKLSERMMAHTGRLYL